MSVPRDGEDENSPSVEYIQQRLVDLVMRDTEHPLSRPPTMNENILSIPARRYPCPNRWWFYSNSIVMNTVAYGKKVEKPRPPYTLSIKDQLVAFVHAYFVDVGLRFCGDPRCESIKVQCRRAIPPCRWHTFREFVVTSVSCWQRAWMDLIDQIDGDKDLHNMRMAEGNLTPVSLMDLDLRPRIFSHVQGKQKPSPPDMKIIIEIMDVFEWMVLYTFEHNSTVQAIARDNNEKYLWGVLYDLREKEAIHQAIKTTGSDILQNQDLCPNRIWNLALARDSDNSSMLWILDSIPYSRSSPGLPAKHSQCTHQLCVLAHDDTTNKRQLHKCTNSKNCGLFEFPVAELDRLFQNPQRPIPWVPTAWHITPFRLGKSRPKVIQPDQKYIAISHVWADGTGIGLNKQGMVNTCLVRYWSRIATSLQCDGIWWDTVCVPTEKQSRRNALNVMLQNFANAEYTVIHDQELVNIPWSDGGAAAIAVVLSTWFTRGWTGAELVATRAKGRHRVKVLFRNPDPNIAEPIIKDLDGDILAGNQGTVPLMGHLCASHIIRSMRNDIKDIRGLLQMLYTRTTAWEKDRVVIASLMVLEDKNIDTSMTIPQLTRKILCHFVHVPRTVIFHSVVPMRPHGAWSWCPPSVFDLSGNYHSRLEFDADMLQLEIGTLKIDTSGEAFGSYSVLPVTAEDEEKLHLHGSHPAVLSRIKEALFTPETCLILKVGGKTKTGRVTPGVLVMPVGEVDGAGRRQIQMNPWAVGVKAWALRQRLHRDPAPSEVRLNCRYIGCVLSAFPENIETPLIECRFGADTDSKGRPLKPLEARAVVSNIIQAGLYNQQQRGTWHP